MFKHSKNYSELKKKSTKLRSQGLSYSEINKIVPVSKSTLSLWLRDISLNKRYKKRLKNRMKLGQPYGARAQRRIRIERTEKIIDAAKAEIKGISEKELLLIGASLYWAEGAKQKKHNPSQVVSFNNSDDKMVRVFTKWLTECLKINKNRFIFEIYSHENIKENEEAIIDHWSEVTGFPKDSFKRVRYKKDKNNKFRKNQGKEYFGLLRINIRKSTDLNRKIKGWVEGIYDQVMLKYEPKKQSLPDGVTARSHRLS